MYTNEILANQLTHIVGVDAAFNAFMNDDVNALLNALTARGIYPNKAIAFLRDWSYDTARGITSRFANHQMRLFTMASVTNTLSSSYLMNVVTNASYLGEENYGNLAILEAEVQKAQEQMNLDIVPKTM